jgi:hypothetical protein
MQPKISTFGRMLHCKGGKRRQQKNYAADCFCFVSYLEVLRMAAIRTGSVILEACVKIKNKK